jgi:thiol-disulfide isomerase/thioredoxin
MNRRLATLSFFPLLILLALPHTPDEPPTPQSVLRRAAEEMSRHTSMSYDLDYRLKFFSGDDTLRRPARVELVRHEEDSIAGGYVWYGAPADSFQSFYDLRTIYFVDHPQGSVKTYKAHEGERFALRGEYYKIGFFSPMKLLAIIDSTSSVVMTEDVIGGRECWKIVIMDPDEGEFTDMMSTRWFDKATYLPVRRTWSVSFQGEYQYDEWSYENIRFDEVKAADLIARNDALLESYHVSPFERPSEEAYALLADGTTAPDFTGRLYDKGESISLADESSRLVILDFWYSSCYPCMKAMPHLQEIFAKYRERGVTVWGVNSVDGRDAKSEARLPKFFAHNPVDYPIILVDRAVDSIYNVKAFPSLYLLDAERRVVFSQSGFSEDLADRLDSIIAARIERE